MILCDYRNKNEGLLKVMDGHSRAL